MVVFCFDTGTRSSLVNFWIFYLVHLENKGIRNNKIVSQHEFIKAISLASIDPKNYWKSNNNKISIDKANDNDARTIATRLNKRKGKEHLCVG